MKVYNNPTHAENVQKFLDSATRSIEQWREFKEKHIIKIDGVIYVSDEQNLLGVHFDDVTGDLAGLTIYE
tara:strand:- start:8 stop:217 length:210 start_codon:yes stop_codon:yes gene_type:complete